MTSYARTAGFATAIARFFQRIMGLERRDVNDLGTRERPCYAVHLVRPFLEVLRGHPAISGALIEAWQGIDPDERIPVATVHRMLEAAAELTHDPDHGLKAARRTSPLKIATSPARKRSSFFIRAPRVPPPCRRMSPAAVAFDTI